MTNKDFHSLFTMWIFGLICCFFFPLQGAIEGCNQGFSKFCARLISSQNQKFASLPRTLLDRVIEILTTEGTESSYTKMSAGLPLVVESIIVAEPRGREVSNIVYHFVFLYETFAFLVQLHLGDVVVRASSSESLNLWIFLHLCYPLSWRLV